LLKHGDVLCGIGYASDELWRYDMKARDAAMTLDEFEKYYEGHRGVISSVRAYDAASGRWAGAAELARRTGAYTLIVVKFKNNTFLRVNVKPSLDVRLSPGKYASPSAWKTLGVDLTFEEKEFLGSLKGGDLTPDELVARVERATFEGKERLLHKLKEASEKLRR
jgi:hypothetical protein